MKKPSECLPEAAAPPPRANLEYHLDIVLERQRERDFNQLCQDGQKAIASGMEWEMIADDFKCRFDLIASNGADTDAAAKTEAILKAREFDPAVQPPEARAIFTLNGITVATPGNLLAVYAQVKAGKTAALGAMLASIMAARSNADCFGFKSSNPDGLAVLSFDTEQSPADFWENITRTLRRAGLTAPPPWFHSFCFAGLDFGQLLKCIERGIERAKKEYGGIHSIFLDGAGDCVPSVNDEIEKTLNRYALKT
ncbi:MAG TPA: hypothetical protein VFC44_23640 [Candidatus Saccharimonadales bacterium]|nr:hypothetical protein [Candidatus Saccharimonadales bacterium]